MDNENSQDYMLISDEHYEQLKELDATLGMGMTTADVLDALALLTRMFKRIADIERNIMNDEELWR